MNVALVTGATGAAGPPVVQQLREWGYAVRILARRAPTPLPGVEVRIGDIRDRDAVPAAMHDITLVVHMAALLHVPHPDARTIARYDDVNIAGTANVIEAAAASGVSRVVHVSSIAVYGERAAHEECSESTPPAPDTPYARSKLASEQVALAAERADGLPLATVLRPGAIYGPGLKANYLRLVRAVANRRFVPIGSGANRRALIFDRDFARAVVLAAHHPAAAGRVFNVTDGTRHRLCDIVSAIAQALQQPVPRWRLPVALAWMTATGVDFAAAVIRRKTHFAQDLDKFLEDVRIDAGEIQRMLGFHPTVGLDEGWSLTIDALKRAGQLQ